MKKLLAPILPSSRVKPIRTRSILAAMHRQNKNWVNNVMSSITSRQELTNASDDDNISPSQLLLLYAAVKNTLDVYSSSLNRIVTAGLASGYLLGWKHTYSSVSRQLAQILDVSGYNLIETVQANTEMADVVSDELRQTIEVALRKYVKSGGTAIKSELVKAMDAKIGNEINTSCRQARADFITTNQDCLDGINSEIRRGQIEVNIDMDVIDSEPRQEVLEYKLLWTSALLPTTRSWHASRHGHLYSQGECDEFYSENGNSCNCHCSQDVVVTGIESVSSSVLAKMAREHKRWKSSTPK